MQSVSSRIWTPVAVSISYGDNHYTMGTIQRFFIIIITQTVEICICQLNGGDPSKMVCFGYDIWWLGSRSGFLGVWNQSFADITYRSTLTQCDKNCLGRIQGSNRSVLQSLVLDKNDWPHITKHKLLYLEQLNEYAIIYKIIILSLECFSHQR